MDDTTVDTKFYSKHPDLGPDVFAQVRADMNEEPVRNKGSSSPWIHGPPKQSDRLRRYRKAIGSQPAPILETGVLLTINTTNQKRAQGFRITIDIDGCKITVVKPPESGE